jgi:NADH-quinone oxidoreductase subunit L
VNGLIILTMLLPLFGGIASYWVRSKKWTAWPVTISVGISLIISVILMEQEVQGIWRFEWLTGIELGWQSDRLSLAFVALVLFISLLVHLFSWVYMKHDSSKSRYFGFLGLFTFSMVGLLWSDHLLLVFIFWELVGFSSYLLIGFWFSEENNATSGRYAFVMNRMADTALLSGILLLGLGEGHFFISEFSDVQVSGLISVLIVIGAFGKSAQGPFFTWLPRAMTGPTPVSALIHAATMVAAGVYLLVRMHPIMADISLQLLSWVGGITAMVSALAALTQIDIKKVLAYSTVSQLGYMVMGVGLGAPEAAFFHLWTHAFFKAGLFLSAGAVIHYMHHIGHHHMAQDMRAMGGLRKTLRWTFVAYTICALALAGLPFFSGFISKEGILLQAVYQANSLGGLTILLPMIGLFTAMLTAYYMMRQWLLVFFGNYRGDHLQYEYKEPLFSYLPLLLLAAASFGVWYNLNPFGHHNYFLNWLYPDELLMGTTYLWLPLLSIALVMIGMGIGYLRYRSAQAPIERMEVNSSMRAVTLNAFYIDRFYQEVIIKGFLRIGELVSWFDKNVIDRMINSLGVFTVLIAKVADLVDKLIVDGVTKLASWVSYQVGNFIRLFHSSRVQVHFFWALLALLVVILSSQLW